MNRLLATCLLSACVAGNPPTTDATTDTPVLVNPVGSLGIRGACAHPLAGDGAVVFPDTAIGIQTSVRTVGVVNTGSVDLENRTQITWTFEGPDAAAFTIESTDPSVLGCQFFQHVTFVPNESCNLSVKFHPTTLGPKQAVLHAVTRRPTSLMYGTVDQTFTFRANVVAAPAAVVTDQPDLVVGGFGVALKIENRTAAAVDLGTFTVGSPFSVDPGSCGSSPLAAGDSCTATVHIQSAPGCPTSTLSTTTGAISVPVTGS